MTASAPPQDLWAEALTTLNSTKHGLAIDSTRLDRLNVLKEVKGDVEKLKGHRKSLSTPFVDRSGKTVLVRDVLDKLTIWINKFIAIGDTIVQYDPGHAALPWAAVRLVLQVAINDQQNRSSLADGMEHVAGLITRYAIVERIYLQISCEASEKLKNDIVSLYAATLQYLAKARKYYGKGRTERLVSSVVKPKELGVEPYVEKMNAAQAKIDTWLPLIDAFVLEKVAKSADKGDSELRTLATSQRDLKRLLNNIDQPVVQIRNQISSFLGEQELSKIVDWLSDGQYRNEHRIRTEAHLTGTGDWLFHREEFKAWESSHESKIFWLHGQAGAGKSVLLSSVIEYLRKGGFSGLHTQPVAYFYCTRAAAYRERADPANITRNILEQLSWGAGSAMDDQIIKLYREKKEGKPREPQKLTLDEATDLIISLLERSPAIIVIDALDECDSSKRQDLILALQTLVTKSKTAVKIFVSSRDDYDILSQLRDEANVSIESADNKTDIENFVSFQVNKAIEERRLLCGSVKDNLKNHVIKTLIEKADGMFRLVTLHIQTLCDPGLVRTDDQVISALKTLPKDLVAAYDVILAQISGLQSPGPELAFKTLRWLLCAVRLLKTADLIAAIGWEPAEYCSPLSQADILANSCNLLVHDKEQDVFRFAHSSVQDYLESREEFSPLKNNSYSLDRCLSTIHAIKFDNAKLKNWYLAEDPPLPGFTQYAFLCWPYHYQQISEHQLGLEIQQKLDQLLLDGEDSEPDNSSFSTWITAASGMLKWSTLADLTEIESRIENSVSSPKTPLFLACSFGFVPVLRSLEFQGKSKHHQTNQCGNTPLHVAARFGNKSCVNLLLQWGADINSTTTRNEIAMYWTMESFPDPTRRLNSIDFSPLRGMSVHRRRQWENLYGLLEDRERTVETVIGWTPLHKAAYHGRDEIVELLLAKGADCEITDNRGATALYWASTVGRENIVALLTSSNASIDTPDNMDDWTPLHRAAHRGHLGIVGRLLDSGANINAETYHDRRTALDLASEKNHKDVEELLKDYTAGKWVPNGRGSEMRKRVNATIFGRETKVYHFLDTSSSIFSRPPI